MFVPVDDHGDGVQEGHSNVGGSFVRLGCTSTQVPPIRTVDMTSF